MKLSTRILAIREAGYVLRCHTIPHHGSGYNVATHSYNALSLLLLLYPGQPSAQLMAALLWHDVPERWTGDIPAPAKWMEPALKKSLTKLEEQIFDKLELHFYLSPIESEWLRYIDLLELYLWTVEQAEMGNRNVMNMKRKILGLFTEQLSIMPREITRFLEEFVWERVPDCDEFLTGEK